MAKLTCMCGYVSEDADHYMAEGSMWHHAMKDHMDDIKKMSAKDIAGWLRNADKEMGVA